MEYRICVLEDHQRVVVLNEMRSHAFGQPMSSFYKCKYRWWMGRYFLRPDEPDHQCYGAFDGDVLVGTMCSNTNRVYPKFRWDHWRSNINYPLSIKKNAIAMNGLMSFMFSTMFKTRGCTSACMLYPTRIFEKYKYPKVSLVGSENVCYDFEVIERIAAGDVLSERVKHDFNIADPFEAEMLFLEAMVKNEFLDKWKSVNS